MKLLLTSITSLLIGGLLLSNCSSDPKQPESTETPVYAIKVVNTFPHDTAAYTQGLLYQDGFLYESTGRRGQSNLRKVELKTGKVLHQHDINPNLFGEGLALWQGRLFQLTWHAGKAFVYDLKDFKELGAYNYPGEGWGLTTNGKHLIQSNGSADLKFLDPNTFSEVKRIRVTDNGKPIKDLNELEFIRGEIFANVWMTNKIARINPQTGKITAWLDLSSLVPANLPDDSDAVLNGIAYDSKNDRLFVTGKLWPKLYEIQIVENK